MTDLGVLFTHEFHGARTAYPPDAQASVTARVVAASSKRRRTRVAVTVLVTLAAVAITGVGSWFVTDHLYEPAVVNPSPSPSVDPSATAGPNLDSSSWTVDWTGVLNLSSEYVPANPKAPLAFDDGLDHANLPPLVDRPSPRYPNAHAMTEEIWDHVGSGWVFVVYGPTGLDTVGLRGVPSALHLVSSEGVHFQIATFDAPKADYVASYTIDHVNLDEGWIQLTAGTETDIGWTTVIDLHTGAVLNQTFSSEGGVTGESRDQTFATFADGSELRSAGGSWESRDLVIWKPSGETSPVAGLSELSYAGFGPVGRDGYSLLAWEQPLAGVDSHTYLIDARLATATEIPLQPTGNGNCRQVLESDASHVVVECWGADDGAAFWDIPFDGGEGVELSEQEARNRAWEELGLNASFDHEYVTRIEDPSAVGAPVIFEASGFGVPSGAQFVRPSQVGPQMFIFAGAWTKPVVGYDRSTGTSFALIELVVPDTGATAAISSSYPLPWTPDRTGNR